MENPYESYLGTGAKPTRDASVTDFISFYNPNQAVENRRTIVVEGLRKRFDECNKMEIFDNLIQGADYEDNTVLHLAATSDQDWNISGAALKMMWHFK
ncbi:putative ankyrin repeat protein, partial [Trifolium medium]|nr:putative ankyrin repeat protein [Trifolium medium]